MSLELILGPMFAGKTSALQSIIRRHEALGINCIVYKPISDTRYGDDSNIYTHDLTKVSAVPVKHLSLQRIDKQYENSKLVVIEEGQFFDDLYEFVLNAVDVDKKTVIVGGLDGDCFRKPFGQILNLIPIADRVTKLTSLCKTCANGTPGLFTFRTSKSKEIVEVGGSEAYIPLCRNHYLKCSAIVNSECPICSNGLAGSVYRPRCSVCPWDSNEILLSDRDDALPTIQVKLEGRPIENQLKQTTQDICQT